VYEALRDGRGRSDDVSDDSSGSDGEAGVACWFVRCLWPQGRVEIVGMVIAIRAGRIVVGVVVEQKGKLP